MGLNIQKNKTKQKNFGPSGPLLKDGKLEWKGAQCSEPVKSKVPSMWFLCKHEYFLVTQEKT